MNIALISPSHVPFMLGGAERLWRNMCEEISSVTNNNVDIINIPAPEGNFWEIIDSYKTFYGLNLNHFDMVISGKNPCWMVQHSNHIVYMLHPLRGVYDTYPLFHLPLEVNKNIPLLMDLARDCDKGIETGELFSKLTYLQAHSDAALKEELNIPSPFLRKVLHRLDANALSKVRRIHPISDTVKNRTSYFHGREVAQSLPPPSGLQVRRAAPAGYFLTYSRLDGAKRIDLIIEAFKKTTISMELKVVGQGPELQRLKQLAACDERIKFLGRLADEDLIQVIAEAYSICFTPYQEDYGLVTIEALKAGKPVITTSDAGGPLDFVKDGINGFVCMPDPVDIGDAITRIAGIGNYLEFASAAQQSVAHINWKTLILALTDEFSVPSAPRKQVAVFTTYPIYPPKGGGQARVYYLCRELEVEFDVHVLCMVDGSKLQETISVSKNFTIECVPASQKFSEKDWNLYQISGIPSTDIAMSFLFEDVPEYLRLADKLAASCDVLVAEQCYVFPILERYGADKYKVYNSQNVEITLKSQMLASSKNKNELLTYTKNCEELACRNADRIIYCSQADKENMMSTYSDFKDEIGVVIENGADISSISYLTSKERIDLRHRLKISGSVAIFIASWHEPNIEAVRNLSAIAEGTPEINYLILGTVGDYFKNRQESISKNIHFAGLVSVEEKDIFLQCANVGINPMTSGSGTNIKMFDYMAAGLPIVSTEVGARGIDDVEKFAMICPLIAFAENIRRAVRMRPEFSRRSSVVNRYSWQAVGDTYRGVIRSA